MKFCYCDESGIGAEPIAVMAGVIVDAQRMHKTKAEWECLLKTLSITAKRRITELHTKDFYPGNGQWRGIDGPTRAQIITDILLWLNERRHGVIFSVMKKTQYEKEKIAGTVPAEINTVWRALGFHLILGIQKAHQSMSRTKGHTLLVFDNEERERVTFTDLLTNPPAWSDSYYTKRRTQNRLDQIIDVPYWTDSKAVGLVQLADFLAYFIRRYVEITEHLDEVRYDGEDTRLEEWFKLISARQIARSCTYPSRGRCDTANLYWQIAPECVKQ